MPRFDSQIVQLVIAAIVALALLMQALVLLAIFIALRKAATKIREDINDLSSAVTPFVKDARELFVRVAPRIEQTTADVAAMTHSLRVQSADVQSAAAEIVERTRRQASRIDTMTTGVLDAADRAGAFVSDAVAKPMRQLSGILASVKAVVETLRAPEPAPRPKTNHAPNRDPEMFV
jgi:hypothetical protein